MTPHRRTIRPHPAGPPAATVAPRQGSIGRGTSPYAEAVSDALRRQGGEFLRRRRRVAALSLGATGALGVVGLYQFGLITRLPEPPVPYADAEAVDATGSAYKLLGTPDSALGMASYAATLALAGMGGATRATEQPWLPLLMAGKVVADAASAGYLTVEQLSGHRRVCTWCVAAMLCSVVAVPQVLPEARAALRALLGRG